MSKKYLFIFLVVVLLGGTALAQSAQPPAQATTLAPPMDRQDPAYRNGHDQGFRHGSNDSAANANYHDTASPIYDQAAEGYTPQYGSLENYQKQFRQGYIEGYKAGWNFNAGQYCATCSPGP